METTPIDALTLRLRAYASKRWQRTESYNIINEYLMAPFLAGMIEALNKVHRIKVCTDENNHVSGLKLQCERDKKRGIWNAIKRFFCRYETAVTVWHNGQLFLCEYYKYTFFEFCDNMKITYDDKLKTTFGCEFVIVCRATK